MAEEESIPMEWTPTEMLEEKEKKESTAFLPVCKEEKARYSPPSDIFRSTQFGGCCHPYELVEGFEEDILLNRKMNLLMPNEYDMNIAYHFANEPIDQYNKCEIREGRFQTLDQCLTREYRMSLQGMSKQITNDFSEGVRARVVDKDHAPKWDPPTLEQVSGDMVDQYFLPLSEFEPDLDLPTKQREAFN